MWTTLTISMLLISGMPATGSPTADDFLPSEESGLVCADDTFTEPEQAAVVTPSAACSATADCWDGSTVSCSASGSGVSCTAVDSDCANFVRGQATCDGTTVLCPKCPTRGSLCNCIRPGGGWGVWQDGICALQICMIPNE